MAAEIICGDFRIGRTIGTGAQGFVCEATCVGGSSFVQPGTDVALKIAKIPLPDGDPQYDDEAAWSRLSRRIDGLRRLQHPNVVRYLGAFSAIADLGGLDGRCRVHAVVMELLRGSTLEARLRTSPKGLDADEALAVAKSVASGLGYACRHRVVHRDVKPANVFICDDGLVKVIDFGLAAQANLTRSTDGGGLKGTLNYMAPDFVDGGFVGDELSDVFSFGATLHELLTGRLPYDRLEGDSADQLLAAWFARWSAVRDGGASPVGVSPAIDRVLKGMASAVARALETDRASRAQGFDELFAAFEKVAHFDLAGAGGTYRYLKQVGSGGFGDVWKARDLRTRELVAVKRLSNLSYADRFEREAQTMKLLQDRDGCFVRLADYFRVPSGGAGGREEAFLVMEYLPGMPGNGLDEAIAAAKARGAVLDRLAVLLVFERYARGLAVMHAQGIVHRDIKPANLYYAEGHPERAKIMDYGIVRDEAAPSVAGGSIPCTLEYAPPEVVLRPEERGGRGMDVYALGLCLYEALTGRTGFAKLPGSPIARYTLFMQRARRRESPDFGALDARRDADLVALLREMTAFDSGSRLSDASAVAQRIRQLVNALASREGGADTTAIADVTVDLTREIAEEIFRKARPEAVAEAERNAEPQPVVIRPYDSRRSRRHWIALAAVGSLVLAGAWLLGRPRQVAAPAPVPSPAAAVVTNVVPRVVRVRVLRPAGLPPDVACAFDEEPLADGLAIEPGMHVYRYSREGYEDQHGRLKVSADRSEVRLPPPGEWTVSEVEVRPPDGLPPDVSCVFRGEAMLGPVGVPPGDYACLYRRPGYFDQPVAFAAGRGMRSMELPAPGAWKARPVEVRVPSLAEGVVCRVDGAEAASGSSLELDAGDHAWRYERANCRAQSGTLSVRAGEGAKSLPAPAAWEPLPVAVAVPPLERGVVCRIDGAEARGSCDLPPGAHAYEYVREGYFAQGGRFTLEPGRPFELPPPSERWSERPVRVTVPDSGRGVVCRIDGVRQSGWTNLMPGEHLLEYLREGCETQTNRFAIKAGEGARTLPPPGAWTPVRAAPRPAAVVEALDRYELALYSDAAEDWADIAELFGRGADGGYALTADERRKAHEAVGKWNDDLRRKERENRRAFELGRSPLWDPNDLAGRRRRWNGCAKQLGWGARSAGE